MTNSSLPALYARWVDAALSAPLPTERRATCSTCAMCADGSDRAPGVPVPVELRFNPDVKCCSYQPFLPNFRVGQILGDDDPEHAEGRARVTASVTARRGATPLGLGWSPKARDRYVRAKQLDTFGRDPELLCPYYTSANGGQCTVWAHRDAVCSTYFCRHDHGVRGARFWAATRDFLQTIERELADHCVLALGLNASALEELYGERFQTRDLASFELHGWVESDGTLSPDLARRVWGNWYGREADFYRACAAIVSDLDWRGVQELVGPRVELARRRAAANHARIADKQLPETLCLSRLDVTTLGDHSVRLISPHVALDPVEIGEDVFDALSLFDGRSLSDAVEAARATFGVTLDPATIRLLIDHAVLVEPDGRDLPPRAQPADPIRPDDRLRFFRGFRGNPVTVTNSTSPDGEQILTIRCGAREIEFDTPDLLPFGQGLVAGQNGFIAEDAMTWSAGDPLSWDQVREFLETLLAERVLQREVSLR